MSTEQIDPSQEPSFHNADNHNGDLDAPQTPSDHSRQKRSSTRSSRSSRSSDRKSPRRDHRSPGRRHRSRTASTPSSRSSDQSKRKDRTIKTPESDEALPEPPLTKPSRGNEDKKNKRDEKRRRDRPATVAGVVSVSEEDTRVARKAGRRNKGNLSNSKDRVRDKIASDNKTRGEKRDAKRRLANRGEVTPMSPRNRAAREKAKAAAGGLRSAPPSSAPNAAAVGADTDTLNAMAIDDASLVEAPMAPDVDVEQLIQDRLKSMSVAVEANAAGYDADKNQPVEENDEEERNRRKKAFMIKVCIGCAVLAAIIAGVAVWLSGKDNDAVAAQATAVDPTSAPITDNAVTNTPVGSTSPLASPSTAPSQSPTELHLYDPPSDSVCEAIARGETVPGQDDLQRKNFTVPFKAEMVGTSTPSEVSSLLNVVMQATLAPALADCANAATTDQKIGGLPDYSVGNAAIDVTCAQGSDCNVAPELCYSCQMGIGNFLRDDVRAYLLQTKTSALLERDSLVDFFGLDGLATSLEFGDIVTGTLTEAPSPVPTITRSDWPSMKPSAQPSGTPSGAPSTNDSSSPTLPITPGPTPPPTPGPTQPPTPSPTPGPTPQPTPATPGPTPQPTPNPTLATPVPTSSPTSKWDRILASHQPYHAQAYQWVTSTDTWEPDPSASNPDEQCLERYAMATLYYAFANTESNFMQPSHHCDWTGPRCNGSFRVDDINIEDSELIGTFPTEFGILTHITSLNFELNGLAGIIPSEMGRLTLLDYLNLAENSFAGNLPTELGNLSQLTFLNLVLNGFIGPIPTEFGKLSRVEDLLLNDNTFDGTIPSEIGRMTNIREMRLDNNEFSGQIPNEIGALSLMTKCSFFNCELRGTISTTVGSLVALSRLELDQNFIGGPIPTEFGRLSSQLQELFLDDNYLTGSVPTEFGNLASLLLLHLHENRFTGPIPTEIGNMADLRDFTIWNNGLTGTIPPEIGSLALTALDLSTNQLTGQIPVLPSSLNECFLAETYNVPEQNCFTDLFGCPDTTNAGICSVVNNCI